MEKTFEQQLTEQIPKLKRQALKLTKNEDKADDILQDTLYKAIKYQNRYEQGTNLSAWLYTILRNTFYDSTNARLKPINRNTVYFGQMHDDTLFSQSVNNTGVENISLDVLSKVIEELEDKYKEPFVMSFKGFKYKEIAIRLNIPLGTVKARIFKAKEIIKEKLKNLGYEEYIASESKEKMV